MTEHRGRHIGRVRHGTHDSGRDEARKTLVCVFEGHHYVAEREGETLRIFMVGDSDGRPATVMDGRHGLRVIEREPGQVDLNQVHEDFYRDRDGWGRKQTA
jgi:hypothetical protein